MSYRYTLIIFLYKEDRIKHYSLNKKHLVIDSSAESPIHLNLREMKGSSLDLSFDGKKWILESKGEIKLGGYRNNRVDAEAEKIYIGSRQDVALRVIKTYKEPVATIRIDAETMLRAGRGADNDIVLYSQWVSGHHAAFYRSGSKYYVEDRNSTNGTWINSQRIYEAAALENGSVVQIEEFSIVYQDETLAVYGAKKQVSFSKAVVYAENNKDRQKRKNSEAGAAAQAVNRIFTRSPRIVNGIPSGEVEIEAAPALGQKPEINMLSVILPPICMLFVMLGISFLIPSYSGNGILGVNPYMFMSLFMMPIGIIVSVSNYRGQVKKFKRMKALRKAKYENYLNEKKQELLQYADEQRKITEDIYPSPAQCMEIAREVKRRLWERMPEDEDFMRLRIGVGTVPLNIAIKTPKIGFVLDEDTYLYSPEKIKKSCSLVDSVPVFCDMKQYPSCGVVGKHETAYALVRSMLIQAAAHHGYDELKIVGLFSDEHEKDWKWLRFLPHIFSKNRSMRFLSFGSYRAEEMLKLMEAELKQRRSSLKDSEVDDKAAHSLPYYLFVIDDLSIINTHPIMSILSCNDAALNAGYIVIADTLSKLPRNVLQIIQLNADKNIFFVKGQGLKNNSFKADAVGVEEGDIFSRSLAPIRLSMNSDSEGKIPESIGFMQGYGINRPGDLNLWENWNNASADISMEVPIGIDSRGDKFCFNIHEKAHGPHGIVAGTTGSGKSEMIQTWILSMALQFSPQDVSFVLIDFKGTGLILPFKELPHLAGTISDMDSNISRNLIALRSELQRRKELFDRAGTNNIHGYLRLYREGKVKEPLSYLIVIIDEYAEFKVNYPDFTKEIDSLFRTGRALGVHIILMTQNPGGVISGESESNVQFRWCLKVANAAASKEILGGHPEAARITNPGRAYIRVGEDEVFEQVQSFYSGGAYSPENNKKEVSVKSVDMSGKRQKLISNSEIKISQGNEIDALVKYIHEFAQQRKVDSARQIWMEQLPRIIYLQDILPDKRNSTVLAPIVGMLDDTYTQNQYPLSVPLSEEGHAVICGSPGSGKTTFLQSLIMSLCAMYTPDEVNIYIMDFGSWSLGMFSDFPQVGGVSNSNENERVGTIRKVLEDILDERKMLFEKKNVGSIQSFNRIGEEILPYVVLIIDNIAPLLQIFSEMEAFLIRLTQEGGSYGIYLIFTCGTTSGAGFKIKQNIKTKIALQMADQADYYSIVGRTGGIIPQNTIGRGLFKEDKVLEFQTALPAMDEDENKRSKLIREEAGRQKDGWTGRLPETLKMMPEIIPYGSVSVTEGFALGLSTRDIKGVAVSDEKPHTLLISGTTGSGKTNLLKVLAMQMKTRSDSKVYIFGQQDEYKRVAASNVTLMDSGEDFDNLMADIKKELTQRQDNKNNDNKENIPSIYILVDGISHCIGLMSQESVKRINALVQMGEGLGVMFIAADDVLNLNRLKGQKPFLNRMAVQQAIMLGGKISDHFLIDTGLAFNEKNNVMGRYEGALWNKDGTINLKFMYIDEEGADGT